MLDLRISHCFTALNRGSDKNEENEDDADMKKMRANLSGIVLTFLHLSKKVE